MYNIIDICSARTAEGCTPLHLAARYNPYNDYESAAGEDDVESDGGQAARGSYNSYTLLFRRQTSSKEAMEFLIATKKVDVCVFSR